MLHEGPDAQAARGVLAGCLCQLSHCSTERTPALAIPPEHAIDLTLTVLRRHAAHHVMRNYQPPLGPSPCLQQRQLQLLGDIEEGVKPGAAADEAGLGGQKLLEPPLYTVRVRPGPLSPAD
jgi:hypothetical protein